VFDTNVLVSAYGWPGGTADRAYAMVRSGTVHLLVSEFILEEVNRILTRKLGWSRTESEAALAQIRRIAAEVLDPPPSLDVVAGGPTDNRILECAVAAAADVVVTGDARHLLPLRTFGDIRILSPREFLETIPDA
jgi:putative PIN family toxin of toxin-antitoxin system